MTKTIQELFDLTGRTAIVTGGGTHLGTAFTEALCDLGAKVTSLLGEYDFVKRLRSVYAGETWMLWG